MTPFYRKFTDMLQVSTPNQSRSGLRMYTRTWARARSSGVELLFKKRAEQQLVRLVLIHLPEGQGSGEQ